MNAPSVPYLKSLVECHKKMVDDGYKEEFLVEDDKLKSLNSDKLYGPTEISIVNFFRFEGESNPDDNSIMYVIETNDGIKGTLIDAYGIYNDPRIAQFIQDVGDIHKRVVKN